MPTERQYLSAAPVLAAGTLLLLLVTGACSRETGLALGEERVDPEEPEIEQRMIELTKQITARRRDERGDGVLRRFNQPRTIGCVDATLTVAGLPDKLAQGLFASPAEYPARLRFANATEFDDREADLRGLSIKVYDVPGAQSVDGDDGVQDFTMNSHPALFAATPDDFLSFVEASADERVWWYFFNPLDLHIGSLLTVLRARDNPSSPLAVQYYSTTPYRYGELTDAAVKFSARSCEAAEPQAPQDDPDYLRAALARAAAEGTVCLELMVQFQTDPDLMPIEDASVVWSEDLSPYQTVARLVAQPQDITTGSTLATCETMRFNPWNGLAAHRPLGGINRVRRNLYAELSRFRVSGNSAAEAEQ